VHRLGSAVMSPPESRQCRRGVADVNVALIGIVKR
jgi:hypothetical protein